MRKIAIATIDGKVNYLRVSYGGPLSRLNVRADLLSVFRTIEIVKLTLIDEFILFLLTVSFNSMGRSGWSHEFSQPLITF